MSGRWTKIADHEREDGSIDWRSYNQAKVANGEICFKCSGSILFNRRGGRSKCHSCKSLEADKGEVDHDNIIRCPHCKDTWEAGADDDYEVYAEGEHDKSCSSCDKDFVITTHVSYSFTSPPLEEEKEEDT
jgi:hypothetical protein